MQLWGEYLPAANAGKSPYPLFPEPMQPPFNVPPATGVPTMDGFAVDYYANFCWEKGRAPTEAEMRAIGGMFTRETAPVINRLAAEFAVFTRWFCEVPSCTFPNRSFYHAGTSLRKIDNESVVSYAWEQEMPNLFGLLTRRGIDWRVYFDTSQIVPDCAINLAGLRHVGMWRSHSAPRPQFFADAAAGRLPAYAWLEPNMLFPPLDGYHPPTDIRAGEQFLARVFRAVRESPQWPQTALIVLFDEHGGCYDHVPPPAAPVPDDHSGEQGFGFDRFGLRVPAFNRSAPRADRIDLTVPAYHYQPPNGQQRAAARGDAPDAWLLADKWARADAGELSQLAWWTLRNAARLFGDDPGEVPATPSPPGSGWRGGCPPPGARSPDGEPGGPGCRRAAATRPAQSASRPSLKPPAGRAGSRRQPGADPAPAAAVPVGSQRQTPTSGPAGE